ncbi:response regulator transcription factor [Plantactinospora mayteni]|uniref:DNA-binding response regulator n=1 Tax=Plantactinospora mayteni TaxID=566021 RepID=A0ABQ4EJK4_9ACTN|nr:response regulator transcription factor [Plantactinospora mayteni]GIG94893.1 DNA-binding response regulator [Plantactinospora mayteni]
MADLNPPVVRVIVVDDDPLVRTALTMMLDGAPGISVVGTLADGDEVPGAVDRHGVDVALMDIRMPRVNGILATRRLRARHNPPEVIMLTTFDTDDHVVRALRAGASGFLLKDTPPERIVDAIRKVAAGEPILSPAVTRRLMERITTGADAYERARSALATLSPREREVALAVAQGRTNAEIASSLAMSVATVKAHLTHILTKLDLGNRTQVAMLAHDAGLI